jgi:hypothetical protein
LVALPATLCLAFVFFFMPFEKVGRPIAVTSGKLACGDVRLTQTFTGTSDPYFVLFYFRANGAREWVEFYVDDESPYWRGSLRVSPNRDSCSVTFYESEELSYRCGDHSLERRRTQPAPARALVADPMTRDYRQPLEPSIAHGELDAYWADGR